MSSDDAYAKFLDQANEDPNAGRASTKDTKSSGGSNVHTQQAPKRLVAAAKDQFYVSESDEPFVPVSFNLSSSSSLPTEGRSSLCYMQISSYKRSVLTSQTTSSRWRG